MFLNISGYLFLPLENLGELQTELMDSCRVHFIKGTILLSSEGININLSGKKESIDAFRVHLCKKPHFHTFSFLETYSEKPIFKRLKVRIKKEIITMKDSSIHPEEKQAPVLSPSVLKSWLDEKKEFVLLDTRNEYEVRFGTFEQAVHLNLNDFSDFTHADLNKLEKKPIVTFCTGGIRCEKAALFLLKKGYQEVYQLKGGILNYFKEIGGEHYQGTCFTFDERIALNDKLSESGIKQCLVCQGPADKGEIKAPSFVGNVRCKPCEDNNNGYRSS